MCIKYIVVSQWGFSSSSVGKEFACNAGDCLQHWRPGLGRFSREGNGNPLQYSCLGIPWDRRAWWATVCGVARVGDNLVTKPLPPVTQWVACWVEFVSSFRYMGFPGISDSKKNLPAMQETWVWSLGWEDSLEKGLATHSSILTRRIPMARGAWWAIVHGVAESDTTEWLRLQIEWEKEGGTLCIIS